MRRSTINIRIIERNFSLRIRIDLKIFIFFIIFYFTNQLSIYLIIMLFSILHEIGHIIVGLILKMKPTKLEIMPFGVSVSFNENVDDKYLNIKEIFLALAGPLTSLILAIVALNVDIRYIAKNYAIYSNLLILFFNLIPIYPLDGGRILKGFLNIGIDSIKTNYLMDKISYITMIILTGVSSIAVYYYQNIAIFFICIFLWLMTLREKNGKSLDILHRK